LQELDFDHYALSGKKTHSYLYTKFGAKFSSAAEIIPENEIQNGGR